MTENSKSSLFQSFQNKQVQITFSDGFSIRGRLLCVQGRLSRTEKSGYYFPKVLVLENCCGFSLVRGSFVKVTLVDDCD